MDVLIQMPLIIYDDKCSLCSLFAKTVSFFGRYRISLVGHYSKDGQNMRSALGDHATEMFWLLDGTVAFGGRSAILPLLYHTSRALLGKIPPSKHGKIQSADCTACKGPKAVFFRSASLIRQSQKIQI